MVDQEKEDLRMAMRMSMQYESPKPKRSKPRENVVGGGGPAGSPEESRKMQREMMAAAAERRMVAARGAAPAAQMAEKSVAVAVEEKGLSDRAEGQKCMVGIWGGVGDDGGIWVWLLSSEEDESDLGFDLICF